MTLAVHLGYHKTATTWMQQQVFIPNMGFAPLLNHQVVDQQIIRPHDLFFDPIQAKNSLKLERETIPKGMLGVVSSETLSGHPFFGGRQSASIARRLQKIAPDAQIIICVRSQNTMLPSVYMQYLQRGGTLPHQQFFSGGQSYGYPSFELEHFQYHRLISLYQSLFEKVHVMTFEDVSKDPARALQRLSKAIDHPIPALSDKGLQKISASIPQAYAPILRAVNQTRSSTLNPAPAIALSREPGWMYRALGAFAQLRTAKRLMRSTPVSDYVRSHLAASFTDSNKQLDHITNGSLDLSAYP
ncbi:MAG: hypothetical protein ABJN34_05740 [Litoreibacter sp.]|uniref:hypothetical protein n=1 Tax=Litoreibacter sp. TaxID=1969459 RepID=UPI003296ED57